MNGSIDGWMFVCLFVCPQPNLWTGASSHQTKGAGGTRANNILCQWFCTLVPLIVNMYNPCGAWIGLIHLVSVFVVLRFLPSYTFVVYFRSSLHVHN